MSGGINMTDAYAFYNFLSYNGGMNHSAVVLVEVNKDVTTQTAAVCKKLMKNFKKDSSKIHHRTFELSSNSAQQSKCAKHFHFSGIDTNNDISIKLSNLPSQVNNITSQMTGKALKVFYSETEPLFISLKSSSDDFSTSSNLIVDDRDNNIDEDDHDDVPGTSFAGQLHECFMEVYQSGFSSDRVFNNEIADAANVAHVQVEDTIKAQDFITIAKTIAEKNNITFPPIFEFYWAKKANKTYITEHITQDIQDKIVEMYKEGAGVGKKADKISAEVMVARMNQPGGIIHQNWVAKLVVSVSKVKSFISQRSLKEKKTAEKALKEIVADGDPPQAEEEAIPPNELSDAVVEDSIENEM